MPRNVLQWRAMLRSGTQSYATPHNATRCYAAVRRATFCYDLLRDIAQRYATLRRFAFLSTPERVVGKRWIPQAATCCRSVSSWVGNWPDEIKSPPWRPPSLLHMTCAICSSSRRRQMLRERRRCHQHHAHRRSERHTNVQNLTRNHSSRDDGKKTSLAMMK